MKLSLCMIVKDEETLLPHCLNSVQNVADEIIIVDTGSIDKTLDVARKSGARVYSFEWCNDFAAARNESLKYAQGEWILALDADEVLVPEIIPALKQVIWESDVLAVTLLRQEVGTNRPNSFISRLFRNHPDIRFSRPYHELIDDSVTAISSQEPYWRIVELAGVAIQHTGYQTDTIAQRQKVDRARTNMEGYLKNHPNDAYMCSKLGALYVENGEIKKGLELLKRGLKSPHIEPAVQYELHYHLGSTYSQLQNFVQARKHYRLATEQPISPRFKLGAYNNWGSLLNDQGNLMDAKELFQKTIELEPTFAMGYLNLGMTLKAMGDLAGAINHYQRAIELNPTYADAYQNLGVVLLKVGNVPQSLQAFRRAIDLHQQQGSPEAARLQQGLKEMGLF